MGEPECAQSAPENRRCDEDAAAHNEGAALCAEAKVVSEADHHTGAAAPPPAWRRVGIRLEGASDD
eukprot:15461370-Alexandrium_andersonii.AAC.1